MPTYVFKNKKTGEKEEMILSLSKREELLAGGEWDQVITNHGGFISDHKSTMTRAGSEWKEVLKKVKKGSSRYLKNTIHD
jgi:hypothetical protein